MKGFINNHKKLELITLLTLILSILIVIILELNSIGHEKSSIGVKKAIDEQISLLTTTDKIEVVDINKISSFSGLNEYTSSEYLEKIGSNIVSIMESDKAKLDSTDADKLFTETGYKDLIAELDENNKINDISVSFIKIGKSNLDIGYYDRIIAQFTNNEDARNIYINTIIKIDKDSRIFDIDII